MHPLLHRQVDRFASSIKTGVYRRVRAWSRNSVGLAAVTLTGLSIRWRSRNALCMRLSNTNRTIKFCRVLTESNWLVLEGWRIVPATGGPVM